MYVNIYREDPKETYTSNLERIEDNCSVESGIWVASKVQKYTFQEAYNLAQTNFYLKKRYVRTIEFEDLKEVYKLDNLYMQKNC